MSFAALNEFEVATACCGIIALALGQAGRVCAVCAVCRVFRL